NGTYDINKFDTTTSLALGAEGTVTLPAGYYAKDILVQNTSKDILSGNYAAYTEGSYNATTGTNGNNASHPDISALGTSPYILGINESVTLPAGYYSKQVTINNGVRDILKNNDEATTQTVTPTSNTGLQSSLALATNNKTFNLNINQGITLPAGYYSTPITVNNGIVNKESSIKSALLAPTFPAGYYSGKDIDVPNLATYQTVNGSDNNGINSNVSISTSTANSYNLGINDALVFPAGYYNQSITVNNSIINKGSKDITITNASETITLPAGYYSQITAHTSIDASSFPNASLTYYLKHQHVDANGEVHDSEYIAETSGGCYTEYYTWTTHEKRFKCKDCVKCDYEGIDNLCDDYDEWDEPHEGYKCNCGKTAGASEGTASSASLIQPYQAIYKVEIEYNN
ncbi:MAG: hypothetical protein IJ208_08505, partial [Butyrivibrio sp.]|nr:hypothetical protein [Butyrivibrio sp.]